MIAYGKKFTAALLAAVLLLGLVACGGEGSGGDAEPLTGTVYVPKFLEIETGLDYIESGCSDGKNIYLVGSIDNETETTDPETGETSTVYDSRSTIVRVPLDGSAPSELENFQTSQLPEGAEGSVNVSNIRIGSEGTLWITEQTYAYTFDIPEGVTVDRESRWEYMSDPIQTEFQRQLDSTGNEIARVDTSSLQETLEMDYIQTTLFDKDGDIYACGNGKIAVLDPSLNLKCMIEDESLWGDNMILLSDGTIGVRTSYNDPTTETYGYRLQVIDKAAKGWGESYDLPQNAYEIYSGAGNSLFYYKSGENLYSFNTETKEGDLLLSWLDADINSNQIAFFTFLDDESIAVMTQDYSNGWKMELALLVPTDRSELPEKTTLVYATLGLAYDVRNRIIDFNRTSDRYRIEVRDYSEFNTPDDYSAGLTRLNTEIVAGNVPDILDASRLPLRQYGAKGLLEDLWPYIEKDTEIGGRAGLMDRVFAAAEQEGKLYQVFDNFSFLTAMGSTEIVGTEMSWTLADLQAALEKMPEGCTIFGESDTKSGMLSNVLSMNLDKFVDWNTGACHFDSSEFQAMLEFCNSFPAEFDYKNVSMEDYEGEPTRISTGKQMLLSYDLSGFADLQMYRKFFGGSITFVGFPKEDGTVGSAFTIGGSAMAMSASCQDKDGAWSFIRTVLLPQYAGTDGDDYFGVHSNFPTNRADFDFVVEQAMTPAGYQEDENGNQVLDENGNPIEISNSGWSWDGFEIDIMATTQEEYDQVMALYNAVDTIYSYDQNVYDIVQDVAGGYFSGDRSLEDTVSQIQSRVNLYVNENR